MLGVKQKAALPPAGAEAGGPSSDNRDEGGTGTTPAGAEGGSRSPGLVGRLSSDSSDKGGGDTAPGGAEEGGARSCDLASGLSTAGGHGGLTVAGRGDTPLPWAGRIKQMLPPSLRCALQPLPALLPPLLYVHPLQCGRQYP